jgi:hypothetical protein
MSKDDRLDKMAKMAITKRHRLASERTLEGAVELFIIDHTLEETVDRLSGYIDELSDYTEC